MRRPNAQLLPHPTLIMRTAVDATAESTRNRPHGTQPSLDGMSQGTAILDQVVECSVHVAVLCANMSDRFAGREMCVQRETIYRSDSVAKMSYGGLGGASFVKCIAFGDFLKVDRVSRNETCRITQNVPYGTYIYVICLHTDQYVY